jgi:integrase/recombinase XerD
MLTIIIPGYEGSGRPRRPVPFTGTVPGFFEYLVSERGLRPASVESYVHYLRRFEAWLDRTGVARLEELSPPLLSAYTAERAGLGLAKTSVREGCGVLRVFLRYARREGVISKDLTGAVEWPQAYRLSTLPRSISW